MSTPHSVPLHLYDCHIRHFLSSLRVHQEAFFFNDYNCSRYFSTYSMLSNENWEWENLALCLQFHFCDHKLKRGLNKSPKQKPTTFLLTFHSSHFCHWHGPYLLPVLRQLCLHSLYHICSSGSSLLSNSPPNQSIQHTCSNPFAASTLSPVPDICWCYAENFPVFVPVCQSDLPYSLPFGSVGVEFLSFLDFWIWTCLLDWIWKLELDLWIRN